MIPFKYEDFDPLLASFVEPIKKRKKVPYVAFGRYLKVYNQVTPEPHLFVLDMSGAHAQEEQLNYYVRQKGFRPLKWHLPSDLTTEDGRTPYAELDALCRQFVNAEKSVELASQLKAEQERSLGLQAALERAESQIQKKEKGRGGEQG